MTLQCMTATNHDDLFVSWTVTLRYFYGTLPVTPPLLVAATHSAETAIRGGVSFVATLVFATNASHNVSLSVEVLRPSQPWPPGSPSPPSSSSSSSSSPKQHQLQRHPVFLTQANHRRWAIKGVARGYVGVVYPGADVADQSPAFQDAYPDSTWGTILARSWLASRALDHVLTLPFVDAGMVAISGHSRNGKQAMLAAAFDARITAVVSSSSGSPGMTPYRCTSANTFAEGPNDAPSQWWLPHLGCFKGHEHRLPIDSHGLLALIAPRPMLASTAWTDGCEPTWAVERAYHSGQAIYSALGAANNLRILYRPGQHHGFLDVDRYFDWFDRANGRTGFVDGGSGASSSPLFPEKLLHNFDWSAWRSSLLPLDLEPPAPTAPRATRVAWGLGLAPDTFASTGGKYGEQCELGPTADGCYVATMMTHDRFAGRTGTSVARADVDFGEYISASVYYPTNHVGKLPVVVWLHPQSYHSGYNEGYIESETGTAVYYDLAAAGFAVIAFDAMGFGTRNYEFSGYEGSSTKGELPLFYRRFPRWSVLGKLVHDGLASLDLVSAASPSTQWPHDADPPIGLPALDSDRVYAVGYDVGARVALYMAAVDPSRRLKGVVSINGWTPMRTDTNTSSTGGLRR